MEDNELESMWKADSGKMDPAYVMNLQTWALHARTIEYVQTFKAETRLRSLAAFKSLAVGIGIVWSLLLGVLIYGNGFKNVFFSGSLSVLLLFSVVAIIVYIRQIVWIKRINYGERVTVIQEKLLKLQVSTVGIVRLLWLQLPFYTTFFWSSQWIESDKIFWFTALPVTLVFTCLAIWIYRQISFKNIGSKWFRILIGKKEWVSITDAKAALDEIEIFKSVTS
jgi:hypothetical protein